MELHRISALTVLNCFEQPEQLVDWVKDDPEFLVDSEDTIGVTLDMAKSILRRRQIYEIDGVGLDTLHDIIHTSWGETGPLAVGLALDFLNSASDKHEIKQQIKDDPEYVRGSEDTIGISLTVAQRILDYRDTPEIGGAFSSLRQVADVHGVGPDTLHDIIYSFYEGVGQRITDGEWLYAGPTEKITAIAEYNGRLLGVSIDNKLLMRDAVPENLPWHVIGYVNDVVALTRFLDKLLVVKDERIWVSQISNWVTEWNEIGHANNVAAIAALDKNLYAATRDNKLWMRDAASKNVPWTHIGHADNVVAMTALNGKLYAATNDNKLWIRNPDFKDIRWTHIGQALDIVGLAALDGKLYAATSNNELLIRNPDPVDQPWTPIGHVDNVVTIAAADGLLFAVKSGNRLLMREATEGDASWIDIGVATNVVALATMYGKFYAATSNNKLVVAPHPPMDVPWIDLMEATNIIAITVNSELLYAVTEDNELLATLISPFSGQWSSRESADKVIALACQRDRLVAASNNNRLLTRDFAPADSPWLDVGIAKNAVDLDTTDTVVYAVTDNNELWMRELSVFQITFYYSRTLLDRFRERRPDVPALLLSCDNTNIEVPHIDLVNEILADLVNGAICFGAGRFPTIESGRSTSGTSEERRAWPEHKPAKSVLTELAKGTRPWTLPYDYDRDQAEQARHALPVRGNDVIEAVWRFETLWRSDDGAITFQTHAWSLAKYALNLTEAEIDLISGSDADLRDTWGDEVADSIAVGQSPTIAALQRAGCFDYSDFENALETSFIRQATTTYKIDIRPVGTCNPEQLRLDAPVDDIPAVLDSLHRFERLRRKCDWTSIQLDNVLGAMGHTLEQEELLIVGLIVFLQMRLELDPDAVPALFRDPLQERPLTLRKEKRVLSTFERLFGTDPVILPELTGDTATDANAADALVASIAGRVGVGPDEVRFILSKGYAGIDGSSFSGPLDILNSNDPLVKWRSAVSSVFRVAVFAKAVNLSIAEFIALIDLWGQPFLLRPDTTVTLMDQLIRAIEFVGLAHEAATWPNPPSEVFYLTTMDAFASRVYAPDAIQSGNLIKKLLVEVQRTSEAFETAGIESSLAAGQQALSELLGEVSLQTPDGQSVAESAANRVLRMIEWSSVFPELNTKVFEILPVSAVLKAEIPKADANELTLAQQIWSSSLSLLSTLLSQHLLQVINAHDIDDTTSEFQEVLESLGDEIKVALVHQTPGNVVQLSAELRPLLTLLQVPNEELEYLSDALARRILSAAIKMVSDHRWHDTNADKWHEMQSVRNGAIQRWLPVLTAALQRKNIDEIVIELFANTFSLDSATARMLLSQLLKDPEYDQSLLRAFVPRDGTTKQLEASLVKASYTNLIDTHGDSPGDTALSGIPLAVIRFEPGFQLNWEASPPPDGIDAQHFQVKLRASVATDIIKQDNEIRELVIESTGQATLKLSTGEGNPNVESDNVLELSESDQLRRYRWKINKVRDFLSANSPDTDTKVQFEITFTSLPVSPPGSDPLMDKKPVLRVLIDAGHGEFSPLPVGTLGRGLMRFDKAARVIKGLSLPLETWPLLANLPEKQRIDLNSLPITTDQGAYMAATQRG
ncbi:MAG: hypothetical protein ACYTEW_19725 [Planctomycetota bacterium]